MCSYNFKTSDYVSTDPTDYDNAWDAQAAAEHYRARRRWIDARRLELRAARLREKWRIGCDNPARLRGSKGNLQRGRRATD